MSYKINLKHNTSWTLQRIRVDAEKYRSLQNQIFFAGAHVVHHPSLQLCGVQQDQTHVSGWHLPSPRQFHTNKGRRTVENATPLRCQRLCPFSNCLISIEPLRHDADVLQVLSLKAGLQFSFLAPELAIKRSLDIF